ncbi:hypothetical protein AY601_5051 [Pedobacter cryoconitis]|uniref:Uncharacterized protein n=1 Tax=Pedobacter cryoconitis TaxID=188932 RepID=A0A127VKK3_9SPHI|nr:hypothetical protein [Pedobacter cryoconitis]AMQ01864.1 hypothetical protein AY601_5051 [Pedobacter cryoconitis]
MINKGKIIFINGHWQNNWIGRVAGADSAGKTYWNGGDFNSFARAAQHFFGLNERIDEGSVCLDGSSMVVLDEVLGGRAERAYEEYSTYEWAGTMYKKISDKFGYGLSETSFLRNKIETGARNAKKLATLTHGMDKTRHSFYIVGHSEGCAYAAGLAKLLLEKGWKVTFIIYLSSFDSGNFDSPQGVRAYQLGYTGKASGDWATNNNPVHGGVERIAIAYKDFGGLVNDLFTMHGDTKGSDVWNALADLRTLMIKTGRDYGYSWQSQIPQSTPNHTVFAWYNGTKLDYKQYMAEENSKINQFNYKSQHKY